MEIVFRDERHADAKPEVFYYKDGTEEFVKQLNKNKTPLHPKPIAFRKETKEKNDNKDIEVHVEIVLQYNDTYNDQVRRRLLVLPGITGLWQVSGRSDLSWEDSVRLDLSYVENWSITNDVLIAVKTVRTVATGSGSDSVADSSSSTAD